MEVVSILFFGWLLAEGGLTTTDAKKVKITVTSVNCIKEKCDACGSQIIIDSKNYSPQVDGLNIAILNPFTGAITTTTSFQHTQSTKFDQFLENIPAGDIVIATSQLLCGLGKTTDLRKQKAIIYLFGKLGAHVNIQPVLFRSGAYIFCKDVCIKNVTKNIDLPVGSFSKLTEDAVLISFSLEMLRKPSVKPLRTTICPSTALLTVQKIKKQKDRHITLLVVACTAPLFVLAVISFVMYMHIRRRFKMTGFHRRKVNSKKKRQGIPLNESAAKFCECKKSSMMSDTMQRLMADCNAPQVKHTTSFRLFHKSSDAPAAHKLSFATYVEVSPSNDDVEHEDTCIYKVPSSLKRHAPPKHLPPVQQSAQNLNSKPEEYPGIEYHDYASLDEVGFISSSSASEEQTDYTPDFRNSKINDTLSASGFDRVKELYDRCSTSLRSANDQQQPGDYEDYINPL